MNADWAAGAPEFGKEIRPSAGGEVCGPAQITKAEHTETKMPQKPRDTEKNLTPCPGSPWLIYSASSANSVSGSQKLKRTMNCMIRMKPDCEVVVPKLLPGANVWPPERARTVGRLNKFTSSSLISAAFLPPRRKFFWKLTSVLNWVGVRRSVIVLGELPKLPN